MLFQKINIYHVFTLFQAKEKQPCRKHLISNIKGQKAMESDSMNDKEIERITSKPEENKHEKINRSNKKAKIKPKYSSSLCFLSLSLIGK